MHLSDGIAYCYDDVYSIGGKDNKIYQVIITGNDRAGITIIDTKTIGKVNKKLHNELGFYFTTLYDILMDPVFQDCIDVDSFTSHTVADIREQIIIDNSQELRTK